ncbi:hypothetical protein Daesc_005264 [Daldinia eschscholtzii]|uniref:Protein kinase domain-containing protein n=1 Tax=Daldinia eschscholtzii TaxID=292717 RepID=A0AAX6MKN6_9PEZI
MQTSSNTASATSTPAPERFIKSEGSEERLLDSTHSLPLSPHITIQQDADKFDRPSFAPHLSAPPDIPHFQSPMRHHRRTPSQHREVKETLNARTEYTNDETDGRSQQTINQYTIREEIGRGSYGAVHLATDQFGNEFALKEFSKLRLRKRAQSNILRRPEGGRPRSLGPGQGLYSAHRKQLSHHEIAEAKDALFLIREEVAIMKKLNHPNLVQLFEVLDDPENDSLYMVLEMCKKGVVMKVGLEEQATPYDDEQCRLWFRDLILGIEYLHAQGIIHRDIKPDNLLLTDDDVLKIVDFGVSEMFEKPDHMMTSKSAGSPAFLPPELCQARHGDVSGKAADIWSMGVTLYCLKYGRLPFIRDNVLDMYDAIRTEEIQIPIDNEDPNFVDLISKILDKNNETRLNLREIRLKAIRRFKGLISKSRVATPENKALQVPHAPESAEKEAVPENAGTSTASTTDASVTTEPARQKSIAEEAAELVRQRRAFLAAQKHASTHPAASPGVEDKGHAQDVTDRAPLFLGIGTGGHDEFTESDTPVDIVSDSPTGIDFDIYDRAFETEIKRIRSDKKKGRAKTYLTKLVGPQEKSKYVGDDYMVLEAAKSPTSPATGGGLNFAERIRERVEGEGHEVQDGAKKAFDTAKETGHRFANLVMAATKDLKERNTN